MRIDGKLKSWNDERGYGFIDPVHGGQEIFVHIKAFPSGTGRPSVGQALTFEVELGPNGKKRAHSVQYPVRGRARKPQRSEAPADWTLPRLLAIPAFIAIYYVVASHWPVKPVVIAVYAFVSLVAFLAYALDKSAAIQKRWRTPEATLLLIGLACGWPGALLAQQFLRHKTSKPSFVAAFWLTVLLNVAGFVVLHAGMLPLPWF
ncbi:cold shock and DUF1294 domain-containing protein [Methylibium sp. Root1272]|uniref:DUF1294 domain-containing protein n=1 Tax=Methylibium sp. Root1272 TaxID=1736441 RepID=UPI0006F473A0|nr:cold shock and DUF1294 domain-containing protein [Methylibium sp. Root1272]KQW70054.1 DNA-binding protein [Methylibium sp. Root1272]